VHVYELYLLIEQDA